MDRGFFQAMGPIQGKSSLSLVFDDPLDGLESTCSASHGALENRIIKSVEFKNKRNSAHSKVHTYLIP